MVRCSEIQQKELASDPSCVIIEILGTDRRSAESMYIPLMLVEERAGSEHLVTALFGA